MSADEWVEQMRVPTKPLPVIIAAIQKRAVAEYRAALREQVEALRYVILLREVSTGWGGAVVAVDELLALIEDTP